MATDQSFIDFVIEQAALGSRLRCKKMFGEYGVYLDDIIIAFACDNSLFLKPSDAAQQWLINMPQRPPYPGAKNYPVIDEWLDDPDTFRRILLTTATALAVNTTKKPPAKKRSKKTSSP